MTENETATPIASIAPTAPEKNVGAVRERRVGTFTFGLILVLTGLAMTASLFFPQVDLILFVKLSPAALICLGAEVLLSTRAGGRVKYDWVGMLLCLLIVGVSLSMFTFAWMIVQHPEYYLHW